MELPKLPKISQEQFMEVLDTCYDKALVGIPGAKSCYELSQEYLNKYNDPIIASKKFVEWQVAKCTTSGFLTSVCGVVVLPITLPANLVSVWYIQLRMVATIANIMGFDPSDDEVQTLAYICLTGSSVSKVFRDAGIELGKKMSTSMIKKIPGDVIKAINAKIGFRFMTKMGETGIINLGKMVPFIGGIIGGAFDYVGTKIIGKKAIKIFVYDKID